MFAPLNELERLLIAAATDPNARGAFVQAALQADLYLSPAGEPPAGGGFGPIVISKQANGAEAAAIFTAPERLAEIAGPQARVLKVNGRAMFEQLRGQWVHLNPNLVPAVVWSPDDIQEILDGYRTVSAPAGARMLLSHPAQKPAALIEALASTLGAVRGIKGAWLMQAHHGGEAEPVWMLGVDHVGPWSDVNSAIQQAVGAVDLQGRKLEATSAQAGFGKQLRQGIPIFAAKKRGLFDFMRG